VPRLLDIGLALYAGIDDRAEIDPTGIVIARERRAAGRAGRGNSESIAIAKEESVRAENLSSGLHIILASATGGAF